MREYLISKGFNQETLDLLNDENLRKLAIEQGYKK